jgi:hypothetical protein
MSGMLPALASQLTAGIVTKMRTNLERRIHVDSYTGSGETYQ